MGIMSEQKKRIWDSAFGTAFVLEWNKRDNRFSWKHEDVLRVREIATQFADLAASTVSEDSSR